VALSAGTNTSRCRPIMPTVTVRKAGASVLVSTYTASISPIFPSGSMTVLPRQSRRLSTANTAISARPSPH